MAIQTQVQRVVKTLIQEIFSFDVRKLTSGQAEVIIPDSDFPLNFEVVLKPREGYYKNGRFRFHLSFPHDYPNSKPKILCLTKIFHPNISYWGDICLNILSEDWTPHLKIIDYIHGLLFLLLCPNLEDPLNQSIPLDHDTFAQNVRKSLKGGFVSDEYFSENEFDPSDNESDFDEYSHRYLERECETNGIQVAS